MKDRILQIMRKENMSQQEFAKAIEISPASLSSIFNGRTNPTNNHVNAIHHHFPDININWLMFGEGDMYISDKGSVVVGGNVEGELFRSQGAVAADDNFLFTEIPSNLQEDSPVYTSSSVASREASQGEAPVQVIREVVKYIDKPQRRITEIRIFFDDGTYEVFGGN